MYHHRFTYNGRMKHLILGSGPVGLATAAALSQRAESVSLVSRRVPQALPANVRHHALDVRDSAALAEVAVGADVIYQCLNAPYHQWAVVFPPLQAAAVAAARQVGARLVSFENLYPYGLPGPGPFTEDAPFRPCSEKGRVRAAMVDELQRLVARHELEVEHVRASDLFGPGVRESALGEQVMGRIAAGKNPRVLGDPDVPHSWTFAADAGETLARVGTRESTSGRVWHVPSAPPSSQREVVNRLEKLVGRQLQLLPTSRLALRLVGLFQPAAHALIEMLYEFEQPFALSDAASRSDLGQTHTPLDAALERTVAAFSLAARKEHP